jgi:hypothetical protein
MQASLSPAAIRAIIRTAHATGKGHVLNDDEPGLNLRIGIRVAAWTWLGHDAHGRVRRFSLGRYPHVGLAEARRRARSMADEVRRGADPVADARARRASANAPKGHTSCSISTDGKSARAPKAGLPKWNRTFGACSASIWKRRWHRSTLVHCS